MNVAEHTVPSFSCGDGAASAVMADSLDESDFFFFGILRKKTKTCGHGECSEVSDLVHCSDGRDGALISKEREQKVYMLRINTVAA